MLIISQDKTKTIDTNIGNISCEGTGIFYSIDGNEKISIGTYSDGKKAQKVMEMIVKGIELQTFQIPPCKKQTHRIENMSDKELEKVIQDLPDD